MGKRRWFRFHIDRWRNGTFGLKPNEIVAYITVLCELYDNAGFIKRSDKDFNIMARRCGMRPSSFKKAVDVLISTGKLSEFRGQITSKQVTEEMAEIYKKSQKSFKSRSKVGQNSFETIWKNKGNQ